MAQIWTDEQAGPASYSTGGFTITTTLASVTFFNVRVKTPGANLGQHHLEYTLNSPAAGQVKIKIVRHDYDKLSSVDAVTGLPAGVTAQVTSGQTYDAEATHIHDITHTHAGVASGTNTSTGAGTSLDAVPPVEALGAHTHLTASDSFSGQSGSGSSHTHTWNNIYQHTHSLTNTSTNPNLNELANATNLSGTTFDYLASDA